MPFKKGHTGRATGIHNKRSFNLPTIINTMFPAQESRRKQKIDNLSASMASQGKTLLLHYLNGTATLTARLAIIAQCCECSGFFDDGKKDCENPICSLYPFMPYGKMRKRYPAKPATVTIEQLTKE